MLSIMNVTNGELVPNPLHQIITSFSPDWMLISTIVLAVGTAVLVIVTYYYSRQTKGLVGQTERLAAQTERLATLTQQSVTQASHGEQLRTSRYLWERINEKYDPIVEFAKSKGRPKDGSGIIDVPWEMLRKLFREIDYFASLVLVDEIADVRYYRDNLSGYLETIMSDHASPDIRHDLRHEYPDFNRLIERWNINMPDEET